MYERVEVPVCHRGIHFAARRAMPRFSFVMLRTAFVVVASALPATTPIASLGCGGCGSVTVSLAQVTPATSCLTLSNEQTVADYGPCSPPHRLFGTNNCASPLVFAADITMSATAITSAPGSTFDVTLAPPSESPPDHFVIPLKLGTQTIEVSYQVVSR